MDVFEVGQHRLQVSLDELDLLVHTLAAGLTALSELALELEASTDNRRRYTAGACRSLMSLPQWQT